MTGAPYPTSGDRLLVVVSPSGVSDVLAEQSRRPVAALLTSHDATRDPGDLELAVLPLLDAGCGYFVCFGEASEALHDRIDELLVERASPSDSAVMTTWHDDETTAEVSNSS